MRVFRSSLAALNILLIVMLPSVSHSQSKQIDLTGTWIEKASTFTLDQRGYTSGSLGRITADGQDVNRGVEITVVQREDQLIIPDQVIGYAGSSSDSSSGSYVQHNQGTVSDNKFSLLLSANPSTGRFTIEYTGTISNDGHTITGEGICKTTAGAATARGTFTWIKKPQSALIY